MGMSMNNNEDFGLCSKILSEEYKTSNKLNHLEITFTNIIDLESPNKTPESKINCSRFKAFSNAEAEFSNSNENSNEYSFMEF